MAKEIRFGAFVREINSQHKYLSYNHVTPDPQFDTTGAEKPYHAPPIQLRSIDALLPGNETFPRYLSSVGGGRIDSERDM